MLIVCPVVVVLVVGLCFGLVLESGLTWTGDDAGEERSERERRAKKKKKKK